MSLVTPVGSTVPRVRLTPYRLRDIVVRTRTLGFFDDLARHADGGAVELRVPGERMWLLTDPAACRQALVARADVIGRSSRYRRIQAILGHSLLTTDGADHRRRRRAIQPTFQPRHVRDYTPAILAAADDTGHAWRAGAVVRMEQEMAALTLSAIGRAVLGLDGREHADRVGVALDRLQRAIALTLVPGSERLVHSRIPVLSKLRRAIRELQDVAGVAADSEAPFVAALRELTAQEDGLSAQDLRDELLTLLLAGHETTAGTLTWAWWFLDRHPMVGERLRRELNAVVGDREPSYDDLDLLPFTTAVVSETLRLRPAAWIIEREVVAPVDLAGLRPPLGTVLAVSPWILHRDPRSWRDPLSFVPDRWIGPDGRYDDTAPGQPRGAWLPFGAGSHVCVGASFAWTEAVLVLATLARRWRPGGADPAMPMRAGATLRPGKPMLMRLDAC
jgi:cytochrome P450